jgi:expansin (peptidoglycan-binding protein)
MRLIPNPVFSSFLRPGLAAMALLNATACSESAGESPQPNPSSSATASGSNLPNVTNGPVGSQPSVVNPGDTGGATTGGGPVMGNTGGTEVTPGGTSTATPGGTVPNTGGTSGGTGVGTGDTSVTTIEPEPPSKCLLGDPNSISAELIHDVEDGEGSVEVGGALGTWYISSDAATSRTPNGNFTVGAGIEGPGVKSSAYALHATLEVPANAEWGGVAQLTFDSPISASQWEGVKFFAKGSGTATVKVVSANTVPTAEGGTCTSGCSDSHGSRLSLSADWTEVKVYFDQVRQVGFGTEVAFDPSALLGIGIQAQDAGSYDFWIDDLQFFTDQGTPDCAAYPGDSRCEATDEYCQECATDARCECVLDECITSGVLEGPLSCNQQSQSTRQGGSTRYWINQASSDRDLSGGYEALGCGNPVLSKGTDQGSAASQDKVAGAPGDGTLFGALNSQDFGENAALCGACVRVNDRVTIQIVDECPNRPGAQGNPSCTSGHIDLSVAAANQVGGDNPQISWRVVACENTSPEYYWHWDSEVFWGALTITGLKYPAAKVELKDGSNWIQGVHRSYWGAWIFGKDDSIPGSAGTVPPSPWTVRITDIHGQVMQDQFASPSGDYPNPVQNGRPVPYVGTGLIQLPMCL